jgi:hypothetical protein
MIKLIKKIEVAEDKTVKIYYNFDDEWGIDNEPLNSQIGA